MQVIESSWGEGLIAILTYHDRIFWFLQPFRLMLFCWHWFSYFSFERGFFRRIFRCSHLYNLKKLWSIPYGPYRMDRTVWTIPYGPCDIFAPIGPENHLNKGFLENGANITNMSPTSEFCHQHNVFKIIPLVLLLTFCLLFLLNRKNCYGIFAFFFCTFYKIHFLCHQCAEIL